MKLQNIGTIILGIVLAIVGIILIVKGGTGGVIPLLVGVSLCFLGWRGDRTALVIFGHACIVLGCYLITWGVYLAPYAKPTMGYIFGMPLFWGFFSLFGGICAIYHGFCKCVYMKKF